MNNLTQTKQDAKQAYLAKQQDEMLSLYEKANTEERNAILKQIDGFLSVLNQDQKIFWLQFRRRLERLNEKQILFPLGKVFLTVGARQALEESNQNAFEFLARHQVGDWGLVCEDDAKENEQFIDEQANLKTKKAELKRQSKERWEKERLSRRQPKNTLDSEELDSLETQLFMTKLEQFSANDEVEVLKIKLETYRLIVGLETLGEME